MPHLVPPPGTSHQVFAGALEQVLVLRAKPQGLMVIRELGLYASDKNYRTPDLVVVDPKHLSARGAERTVEIAIEILSPNDESRDKLPFYAACGVLEVWLIDPVSRDVDIRLLDDNHAAAHAESRVLGLRFERLPAPLLRIAWPGGAADI
jgi:Uma2 family endonuclease